MTTEDYLIGGAVCAVLAGLAYFGMWRGWLKRKRAGAGYSVRLGELQGQELARFARVFYVLTHPAQRPLERVILPGLAYRGYANVVVKTAGIQVCVAGEKTVALTGIVGVNTGRNSIAKAVEKDGLTLVDWVVDEQKLTTIFRFASPREQQEFIELVTSHLVEKENA